VESNTNQFNAASDSYKSSPEKGINANDFYFVNSNNNNNNINNDNFTIVTHFDAEDTDEDTIAAKKRHQENEERLKKIRKKYELEIVKKTEIRQAAREYIENFNKQRERRTVENIKRNKIDEQNFIRFREEKRIKTHGIQLLRI